MGTEHTVCSKEQEISEIHAMCKRTDEAIRGNGKPGILTTIAVLKVTYIGLLAANVFVMKVLISNMLTGQ